METRETVTLDRQPQRRLFVLSQVLEHRNGMAEAARLLELSERQVKRDARGQQTAKRPSR